MGERSRGVRGRARAGVAAIVAVALGAVIVVAGFGTASARAASPLSVVYHGARDHRVVALTFDDGWSASNTSRIFAILQRRHVIATFFPYALAVKASPALWRSIARAGYPIANHTYDHADLTRLPAWRVRAELDTGRRTIESITGRPMVRIYRPPNGAWNPAVQREAAAVGFPTTVLWDVTSADTARNSSWASIRARAMGGTSGSIVLMHGGPDVTPAILDSVITAYRSAGYSFVTIPQLLGTRVAAWPTPTPKPTPRTSPSPSPSASPGPSATPSDSPGASPSPSATPSESPGPSPSASEPAPADAARGDRAGSSTPPRTSPRLLAALPDPMPLASGITATATRRAR